MSTTPATVVSKTLSTQEIKHRADQPTNPSTKLPHIEGAEKLQPDSDKSNSGPDKQPHSAFFSNMSPSRSLQTHIQYGDRRIKIHTTPQTSIIQAMTSPKALPLSLQPSLSSSSQALSQISSQSSLQPSLSPTSPSGTSMPRMLSLVEAGNRQEIEVLLKEDSKAWQVKTFNGKTVFMAAAERGHLEILKLFYGIHPEFIHYKDNRDNSTLDYATQLYKGLAKKQRKIIRWLLSIGHRCSHTYDNDPFLKDLTKIFDCANEGNITKIMVYLTNGYSTNLTNAEGATLMHFALSQGHAEMTFFLLERKAKDNMRGDFGLTPYLLGIKKGHHAAVLKVFFLRFLAIQLGSSNETVEALCREWTNVFDEAQQLKYRTTPLQRHLDFSEETILDCVQEAFVAEEKVKVADPVLFSILKTRLSLIIYYQLVCCHVDGNNWDLNKSGNLSFSLGVLPRPIPAELRILTKTSASLSHLLNDSPGAAIPALSPGSLMPKAPPASPALLSLPAALGVTEGSGMARSTAVTATTGVVRTTEATGTTETTGMLSPAPIPTPLSLAENVNAVHGLSLSETSSSSSSSASSSFSSQKRPKENAEDRMIRLKCALKFATEAPCAQTAFAITKEILGEDLKLSAEDVTIDTLLIRLVEMNHDKNQQINALPKAPVLFYYRVDPKADAFPFKHMRRSPDLLEIEEVQEGRVEHEGPEKQVGADATKETETLAKANATNVFSPKTLQQYL